MPVEPALILAVESERILVGACRHAIAALVLLRFALDNLYNLTRNDPTAVPSAVVSCRLDLLSSQYRRAPSLRSPCSTMNAAGLKQFTASLSGSK